jgi:predicted membrane-bound mannosyltransferase
VVALRRPTLLRVFLIWAFVLSLVVYSWAGEKFEWLALHPLLPLLLLVGIGVQAIWAARRRWYEWVGLAATALGLAYVVFASWSLNAVHPGDPRQLLVSAQTSPEVGRIADRLVAASERAGRPYRIAVDSAFGATYPWAWYFRDLENAVYPNLGESQDEPPPWDALILTESANSRLQATLGGQRGLRFPFRIWWVPEYGSLQPGWLLDREPWNASGGMPEWLYERR